MRAAHDGLPVIDERLVLLQSVGSRTVEVRGIERSRTFEHLDVVHQLLQRSFELPSVVMGKVVVRTDKQRDVEFLAQREQLADVFDSAVGLLSKCCVT